MRLRWFGHQYTAPVYWDTQETQTPEGAICVHCEESIEAGDDGWIDASNHPFHRACWLRLIFGSVAHIEKRCSCYVPGSDESDPPGLTRRQAAEAALKASEAG